MLPLFLFLTNITLTICFSEIKPKLNTLAPSGNQNHEGMFEQVILFYSVIHEYQ